MASTFSPVVMFILAAFLGALGQFLYKSGAERAGGSVVSYLANGRLLAGIACYIGVMVLFVAAYKRGGTPSVLYPVYASTFIWSAVIAWYAYGVPIRPLNIVGMLLLIGGMYLTGRS